MAKLLNLYLIEQHVNNDYETYDSFVVCAEIAEEARHFNPDTGNFDLKEEKKDFARPCFAWCAAVDVKVTFLGRAKKGIKKGLILGSYNAG